MTRELPRIVYILFILNACYYLSLGFPGGPVIKKLSPKQEMQVQSLSQEDPLEKEMTTYSSILAWEFPWTEEPVRLQYLGSQKVRHNFATEHACTFFIFPSAPLIARVINQKMGTSQ